MPRLSALLLVFLLGGVSAVALVACGSGEDADLLPGTTADQIESNLDEVEQLADARDCIGAEGAVAEVAAEVEELQNVDLKLKAALQEGTRKLSEVVGRCEEEEETSEEPEPTLETDVESDEVEDAEKPKKKDKPDKEAEEPTEPTEDPEAGEGSELPPQANGKGEEKSGGESTPPVAPEPEVAPPSGGVGPSQGVE
jgi:outer membrane biosynthesis protein TonB